MTTLIIIIAIVAWWIIGFAGFIYWWTKDYDFTLREMSMAVAAGIIGPFSWLAGWIIHGNYDSSKIIKHKRI